MVLYFNHQNKVSLCTIHYISQYIISTLTAPSMLNLDNLNVKIKKITQLCTTITSIEISYCCSKEIKEHPMSAT